MPAFVVPDIKNGKARNIGLWLAGGNQNKIKTGLISCLYFNPSVDISTSVKGAILRGINDDELCYLASFAHERKSKIRFIEYMPMGAAHAVERNRTVNIREMLERLKEQFDLIPEKDSGSNDPARDWICRISCARAGFITSISDNFCDSCNRMRLTAEGALRPCLHQNVEVNLKEILRAGGDDRELAEAFRRAARLKWSGHQMNSFVPIYSLKEMLRIGG